MPRIETKDRSETSDLLGRVTIPSRRRSFLASVKERESEAKEGLALQPSLTRPRAREFLNVHEDERGRTWTNSFGTVVICVVT